MLSTGCAFDLRNAPVHKRAVDDKILDSGEAETARLQKFDRDWTVLATEFRIVTVALVRLLHCTSNDR